ncbi:CoA transferase [Streptomyces sp. NPDC059455]|uniref:CoA transferase n=1 Tax=Streptomyces sp. NPDC059455 TaxID=3346837 RepID=UPI0036C7BB24
MLGPLWRPASYEPGTARGASGDVPAALPTLDRPAGGTAEPGERPLRGTRVVDFTTAWSGPLATTADQWTALCSELGWTDWARDTSLAETTARKAKAEEIARRLSEVTREHDKTRLATRLQRAGVPAAPVHNGRDLFEDPQLRQRGWFAPLTHPEAGTHEYAGLPLEAAGRILQPSAAAPLLGQHTADVLGSARPA